MVCSSMLPEMAFQPLSATDVAAGAATCMSDCQSPLDRWLGLPARKPEQKSAPEATFHVSPGQTVASNICASATQFNAPMMPVQQPQLTQMQVAVQVPMQAALQAPMPQPTLVYLVPVGAPSPAVAPAVAPAWPVQQTAFPVSTESCTYDGAYSCSTDISDTAVSPSSSEDERLQATAGRLTASQARRRRRQRAAAFARAESQQQSQLKLASALVLTPEMCAQLTQQITSGGESMRAAFNSLRGSVRRVCFDSQGCRVMQLAIERGSHADVAALLSELQGAVLRSSCSPHGNYVLQKIVEVMPSAFSTFIAQELLGFAAETACHRFGCRILCRLLEHSSKQAASIKRANGVVTMSASAV
eukprot:TRINITY_DN1286_c0_g1_i4.p1 TRINITY_DN1286_c0_g1~~TRINITY_DN1286_c0_g1_i4.p1  ORF type:complete len:359 (-),score=57.19 TRINITY_DN1286_c0_g1_i4:987-2063(-)